MSVLAATFVLLAQLAPSHGGDVASSPPASTVAGVGWTVPKGWAPLPSSPMRVATYRIPPVPGDEEGAELAIFYFGQGQGGSVDANVTRWLSMFTPEPGSKKATRSLTKYNGIPVTLVSTEGSYSSGMPGGPTTPKKGWALLGAIADGPQGAVFFKLTGPKKTLARSSHDFDTLVKSIKKSA